MFLALLTISYVGLLVYLRFGLDHLPLPGQSRNASISVVVAARNEAEALPGLIERLSQIEYPDWEVVITDDRSTDATPEILARAAQADPRIRIVRIDDERTDLVGKKRALTEAISVSRGEVLAFCDADSLPPTDWLRELDRHFMKDVDLVFGSSPLVIEDNPRYERLKNLERCAHHAFAAGALGWNWGVTCSAVNLAYRKRLFDEAGGFGELGWIPSGDDDLMLQRLAPHARRMTFMFSAAVPTRERSTNAERIQRETRRASKWRFYTPSVILTAGMIFLFYLAFTLTFFMVLAGCWSWWGWIVSLSLKIAAEWVFVRNFLQRLNRLDLMQAFPLAEAVYVPYFLYFAIRGSLVKYRWR
jgi:cellulose synthase/poly-beta-1,6-N-acetylglucosamine synthase-like glycosyltransferase